jgi:ribosomal-protein-serine acetyltransferase
MNLKVDSNIELRALELSDTIAIFNTINNQREYLGKWLAFVQNTKKISDTEAFVKSILEKPKERKEYTFSIRKQGEFVGLIGLDPTDTINKKTEIGYWISEKYQKQGIVTKSVQKLCDFAFHELSLNRITIKCAVENKPSKNIPKRLGFQLEGIERDAELDAENNFRDLEIYSKLRSDH